MPQRIEGFEGRGLLGRGVDATHLVDRIDLCRIRPAYIRRKRIFIPALAQLDGFRNLGEQIDDRCAPQTKSFFRELQFQPLAAVVPLNIRNKKYDLYRVFETRLPYGSQTSQIDKKELLGKREVLHQQPMSDEGTMRIR